jgi:hypothetical protein
MAAKAPPNDGGEIELQEENHPERVRGHSVERARLRTSGMIDGSSACVKHDVGKGETCSQVVEEERTSHVEGGLEPIGHTTLRLTVSANDRERPSPYGP